jgi:hypothetical protein
MRLHMSIATDCPDHGRGEWHMGGITHLTKTAICGFRNVTPARRFGPYLQGNRVNRTFRTPLAMQKVEGWVA